MMVPNNNVGGMNLKTTKNLQIALAILAGASTIGGMVLTAVYTPKFMELKKELEESKPEGVKPTPWEYIKIIFKAYGLPIAVGAIGVSSTVGSVVLSNKIQAGLGATIVALDQGYRKYGNQVKKVIGFDKNKEIIKNMAKEAFEEKKESKIELEPIKDEKQLWWEEHLGFFYATEKGILNAIMNSLYILNDEYSRMASNDMRCWITLMDIIQWSDIELVEDIPTNLLDFGWNMEQLCMEWDSPCIHYDWTAPDENGVRTLIFQEQMMYCPENYGVVKDGGVEYINDIRRNCMENSKRVLINRMKKHGATQEEIEEAQHNRHLTEYAKAYGGYYDMDIEQKSEIEESIKDNLDWFDKHSYGLSSDARDNLIETGDPFKSTFEKLEEEATNE